MGGHFWGLARLIGGLEIFEGRSRMQYDAFRENASIRRWPRDNHLGLNITLGLNESPYETRLFYLPNVLNSTSRNVQLQHNQIPGHGWTARSF